MPYACGSITNFAYRAHRNSRAHGFWDGQDEGDVMVRLAKLALIVSEVGEAVEAVRKADNESLGEELADIIIRVFDMAEACGVDIEQMIIDKMMKNENRPYKHGKLA